MQWRLLRDIDAPIEYVDPAAIGEPGNHDQGDRTGTEHAQRSLEDVAHIFNKPGAIDIGTCIIGVVPWVEVDRCRDAFLAAAREACAAIERLDPVKTKPRVLMGHTAIVGALTGSDYVFPGAEDPTVADLIALKAEFELDAIMLGHFHMHQVLAAGICYIGAPKQNTWGEKDIKPGCIIWDSRTPDVFEHIELTSPRFVEVTKAEVDEMLAGEYDDGDSPVAGDFVRYETDEMLTPGAQRKLAKRLGVRSLELAPAAPVRALREGETVGERPVLSRLTIEERIAKNIVDDHPNDEAAQKRLLPFALAYWRAKGKLPEAA